jgi:hypothetical protein
MGEKPRNRESGAWIGQRPDENTEEIERTLDDGAERVAVTNNETDDLGSQDEWPRGHRDASSDQ